MFKGTIVYVGLSAVLGSSAALAEFMGDISPQEAFERASTEANVYILDVRTGQEWRWVGHPGPNGLADSQGKGLAYKSGADLVGKVYNLAYWLTDGQGGWIWGDSKEFPHDDFVTDLTNENDYPFVAGGTDTLLILCRTGGRALYAAEYLGDDLGYTTYRIEHGFEGDKNDKTKPGPDTNYRDVNGWVNSKLPYNDDKTGAYYPK
jgi:rhodanese-related sulfurtransferase